MPIALKQILSEGNGDLSSMRVGVFLVLLYVIVPDFYLMIATGQMPVFSLEKIGMIATAFGAKIWQKGQELQKATPGAPGMARSTDETSHS